MEWRDADIHEDYEPRMEEWREAISGLLGMRAPPLPCNPALLVIDMQRYFLDPEAPAYHESAQHVIFKVQALIDAFEDKGLPIFATRYASSDNDPTVRWWGERLEAESEWAALDPRMRLPAGTVVLSKHLYGTFFCTDIDRRLRALGARSVVICGVMTDLCCETTAREAFHHGYDVYFVADGTATSNERLHVAALATLAHGFAYIVSTEDLLRMIGGGDG
ncbi:MAG: isochorismatase family cysteine hydrolase [Candidatus Thermoplasmatota archaeon]